jgi:hypothetical protein
MRAGCRARSRAAIRVREFSQHGHKFAGASRGSLGDGGGRRQDGGGYERKRILQSKANGFYVINAANEPYFIANNTGPVSVVGSLTDGKWASLIGTAGTTGASLYVNGGAQVTLAGTVTSLSGGYCMGGAPTGYALNLTGEIAEVEASGATPTAAQITSLDQNQHAYYGGAF